MPRSRAELPDGERTAEGARSAYREDMTTYEITHDRRWQAVLERRPLDGDPFVYAVRTTQVYCRPGCTSRRPRRVNVDFFSDPADARAAGYRACRRCRPDQPASDERLALTMAAVAVIEARSPRMPTAAEIAAELAVSEATLRRAFVASAGITPRQYADGARRRRVRERLRAGDAVIDAQNAAGYGSSSRLYEGAADFLGSTPAEYRAGSAGAEIAYATADGPLGPFLVAATERGICHVGLGDDRAALIDELAAEFPRAVLRPDGELLRDAVGAVACAIEAGSPDPGLPYDVRATAFQRLVWQELRRIPAGQTRTYGELAEAIGRPTAVRAVARACATNPLAILTPCHRVIGANGRLAGYRWGAARKGLLLAREARQPGAAEAGAQAGGSPS